MTGLAGQQYDNMCANWGAAANYPGLANPAMVRASQRIWPRIKGNPGLKINVKYTQSNA